VFPVVISAVLDTARTGRSSSSATIPAGLVVRGEVIVEGDLHVLGRIEGEVVVSGTLVVHQGVVLGANVVAQHVVVCGEVTGDVVASGTVEVTSGGRIVGDVRAHRLLLAEQAQVTGVAALLEERNESRDAVAFAGSPAASSTTTRADFFSFLPKDGRPPPARGLAQKRVKPRLFLRRAMDAGRQRLP
jgi:cytoskeletal protein CcmA (bactofilin family)